MRPPKEALKKIQSYCEKTQCRKCNYGRVYNSEDHYVVCTLVETTPCEWILERVEDETSTN